MTFSWTPHRFSGGALALDVANSVVLRFDPARRIDRFAEPRQMEAFAGAAATLGAERERYPALKPVPAEDAASFIGLREAIDRHFRAEVLGDGAPELLAGLLETIGSTLRRAGRDSRRLDTATAQSALRLSTLDQPERLKICPNCQWLFLDRSRNRSRAWCDMAVCGNRVKASRHYHRYREDIR